MAHYWPAWPWPKDQPFNLLGNKILVHVAEPPGKTRSGIVTLDNTDAHWAIPDRGEVIQFGEGIDESLKEELAVGDWVVYPKKAGADFQRGDEHLLILDPDDVLANIGREGPCW